MQISNSSPSFGKKVDTIKVLETASLKMIQSETVSDLKPVIDNFWGKPLKAAGSRGYRYYLKIIGGKIMEKYPEISNAIKEISDFSNKNPKAAKQDLKNFTQHIVEKLGSEIDIII